MRLFWNARITKKGISVRPAIRVGKRLGVTVTAKGLFPSFRIKR